MLYPPRRFAGCDPALADADYAPLVANKAFVDKHYAHWSSAAWCLLCVEVPTPHAPPRPARCSTGATPDARCLRVAPGPVGQAAQLDRAARPARRPDRPCGLAECAVWASLRHADVRRDDQRRHPGQADGRTGRGCPERPRAGSRCPRRDGGASGRRTARHNREAQEPGHRARLPPPRAWALDEFPASPSTVQHQPEYNSIPPSDCPKNQVSHACTFTNMSVYSGLWTDPVECSVAWLRSGWLTAFAPSCMPLCMGSGVRGRHGRRAHRGSRGRLWRNG